jgi:signal transduction histidine kinase
MPNASKLSGEKATVSFEERIATNRFWLTLFYIVVLATILIVSSGITRSVFSQQLNNRFQGLRFDLARSELVPVPTSEEVRADLIQTLVLVNGILLIVAGIASYLVAGATIKPIHAAYTAQKKFLSDASHELRTPLAILQTDLENERLVATTANEISRLDSHLEEIERMRHLVGDLLMLSKLDEHSSLSRPSTNTNLINLVSATVDRLKSLAEAHGVTLHLSPSPHLIEAITNPELLTVALSNIISNAVIYNKPNGTVDITLGTSQPSPGNGGVGGGFITVTDTGIGIAAVDLEHIFDRFWRVEQSRSRQTGGSGLGLAIVQSIMADLGGTVNIISTPNHGTTVTLTLKT